MSGQRSILLLGGSAQQIVAIKRARELGYRTVLCDYLPDNPGQHHADSFHLVSTTDREAVLAVARAERVEGVLAYASDPAAPTAAYVAEELGLPTNPPSAVETLSEKHLFRCFLVEHGFACPRAVSFASDVSAPDALAFLDGFSWPVVVKPTDSSGSKGVSVVVAPDGLAAALDLAAARSRNGVLIAEEYIERGYPAVIGGDVFVVGGEVVFWGLMDCLRDRLAGGLVPVGEAMPSGVASPVMARCRSEIQRLVGALGLRFGEFNVELIVGVDGEPRFLELGARAGGNMIPVQLSDASGVDLVAANVRCAMGDDPGNLSWDGQVSGACCAHYVVHSSIAGAYAGLRLSDEVAPHVYRKVMYTKLGARAEAFDGADKALGILFLRFDDVAQMEGVVSQISRHVEPLVMQS